ncbi:MAG: hypothetical protein OER88_12290, partial [Planctomycetota bacterium]|nr:hypothetical protein [Planctomycetota bacterium]
VDEPSGPDVGELYRQRQNAIDPAAAYWVSVKKVGAKRDTILDLHLERDVILALEREAPGVPLLEKAAPTGEKPGKGRVDVEIHVRFDTFEHKTTKKQVRMPREIEVKVAGQTWDGTGPWDGAHTSVAKAATVISMPGMPVATVTQTVRYQTLLADALKALRRTP